MNDQDFGARPLDRARRLVVGHKWAARLHPGLRSALLALVEHDEQEDPRSPLQWTMKSPRQVAADLTRQGHRVGAHTVAVLLRDEGFTLPGTTETIGRQPDATAQFRYVNEQVRAHQGAADPVVSMDTKKVLVDQFKDAGRPWPPKGPPTATRMQDLPEDHVSKVVSHEVCDLAADTASVNAGTDRWVITFALGLIRCWWKAVGCSEYPRARRLLITAETGVPNRHRNNAWETELGVLAAETGLEITCCHLPPGTYKWSNVEHRLVSYLTMNWRGPLLTSHEVIVRTIAATTIRPGLRSRAEFDTTVDDPGIRIPDEQTNTLLLTRHDWHGDWNYTLHPQENCRAGHIPDSFGQPTPGLGWLCHPILTGLTAQEWDTTITTLMVLYGEQRETDLANRRGHPRLFGTGHAATIKILITVAVDATAAGHRRPSATRASPPYRSTVWLTWPLMSSRHSETLTTPALPSTAHRTVH